MSKSIFGYFSKFFNQQSKNSFCTRYYWDYEYGNPENEFLNSLNEYRSIQEARSKKLI